MNSGAPIAALDAETIGQIAAGEIIERPASVVKELVENAIDAGATRIDVVVEDGGRAAIEVRDDGEGVAAAQLPAALGRHFTSKLRAASDLGRIATLGFRGEGLASIAAVSNLEIVSRTARAEAGARVLAAGEEAGPVEPAAAAPGTIVRATELFGRVPVRREYLRSASAEFQRISAWLSAFALAYPAVAFSLAHNGRTVWTMPGTDRIEQRLAMVFGAGPAQTLLALHDETPALSGSASGFISAPGSDRSDRRMQLLFVNGRLLRSTLLAGAWTAGYSTFAMAGRHPYGALFLDLPPDHVDVNVHPTKSDVRLRYADQTFSAVRRAIAATLQRDAARRYTANVAAPPVALSPLVSDAGVSAPELFEGAHPDSAPASGPRVLEQLDRTFVVASDGEGLLLVDQHAAHERIAYESIVERARSGGPSEPLLVPYTFEVPAADAAVLLANLPALTEGGLEIEPFGEGCFRVVATPAGYGARAFDVRGFLDDLTTGESKQRDVRERVWATLACHSVTVAGERLEPAEMTTLIERLATCRNPMHCPHGRPTMVRLGPIEIARLFKRV